MTTRERTGLYLAADMIGDIQTHITMAWSFRDNEHEQAVELMQALDMVRCVGENLDEALRKLPPEGSPHGGENLDNSRHGGVKSETAQESDDIRGMVAATQGRTVEQ